MKKPHRRSAINYFHSQNVSCVMAVHVHGENVTLDLERSISISFPRSQVTIKSVFVRCYLRSHELWFSFTFIVVCNNVCVECDVFVGV